MRDRSSGGSDRPEFLSARVLVDSSILFSFININCLEQLAVAFGGLAITPQIEREIIRPKQRVLVGDLKRRGLISVIQPTIDESFRAAIFEKRAFGKEVSEVDREVVALAYCRGMILLFEDTPMSKVARDVGINQSKMFNTVRCLKKLIATGALNRSKARSHLEAINARRTKHRLKAIPWEET
ncbi:hypothetical protein J7J84_08000 [bacterium]|nr:hypothetical protein [bacterium]